MGNSSSPRPAGWTSPVPMNRARRLPIVFSHPRGAGGFNSLANQIRFGCVLDSCEYLQERCFNILDGCGLQVHMVRAPQGCRDTLVDQVGDFCRRAGKQQCHRKPLANKTLHKGSQPHELIAVGAMDLIHGDGQPGLPDIHQSPQHLPLLPPSLLQCRRQLRGDREPFSTDAGDAPAGRPLPRRFRRCARHFANPAPEPGAPSPRPPPMGACEALRFAGHGFRAEAPGTGENAQRSRHPGTDLQAIGEFVQQGGTGSVSCRDRPRLLL